MRKRSNTIQKKLFFTYSIIILLVFGLLVSLFYNWTFKQFKQRALDSIDNTSISIADKLDLEIQKLDTISLNIMYSNLVKDRFKRYVTYSQNNKFNTSPADNLNNNKELVDVLSAIIGPSSNVPQIYIYDLNDRVFATGFDNNQSNVKVNNISWYKAVIQKNGGKFLSLPFKDKHLSRLISPSDKSNFLSLCRVFFDTYNQPQGIVEIRQYYDIPFGNINNIIKNNIIQEKIIVYNNLGQVVYPITKTNSFNYDYYYKFLTNKKSNQGYSNIKDPNTKSSDLLSYKHSPYTGWTVVVIASQNILLKPLIQFTKGTSWLVLAIIAFALGLSYVAARNITTPISKLNKAIKSLNWKSISSSTTHDLESNLNELEDLNLAFQKMNIELKSSMEELLMSKSHEMQSKMLSLQSQMNPHFIYNTMATIVAMSEEGLNDQIISMCENFSEMLRYISSDKSSNIDMNAEIAYTEKYLQCMKIRYGSKLIYSIDIDETTRNMSIPKLVIQPLVENAIKYSYINNKISHINIIGTVNSSCWQIQVSDDGQGFSEDELREIYNKIDEINNTGLLPSLELDGMGLLNIYIRLKLAYKNKMIFSIDNNASGGAIITIGCSY